MPHTSRCCCHGGKSWQASQQELKPENYGGNLVSGLLRLKPSKLPHADKHCPEISGKGPPTSINNQDTHSQMWPEIYPMKTISQLWLISHAILANWAIDANDINIYNTYKYYSPYHKSVVIQLYQRHVLCSFICWSHCYFTGVKTANIEGCSN